LAQARIRIRVNHRLQSRISVFNGHDTKHDTVGTPDVRASRGIADISKIIDHESHTRWQHERGREFRISDANHAME
jgi:hypothetical protein